MLHGKSLGDAQRHCDLPRSAVHGIDIAQVHHHCFVAKVLKRNVGEVEVDSLKQEVGGYKGAFTLMVQYCAIVAHTLNCGCVNRFEVFCEHIDKPKFAK